MTDMDPTLSLRIGAIFALLASSVIGIYSPYLFKLFSSTSKTNDIDSISQGDQNISSNMMFRVFKVFTGGLLLSVAVIHLLTDSMHDLSSESITMATNEYPITQAILLCGMAFSLTIEIAGKHISNVLSTSHSKSTTESHSHENIKGTLVSTTPDIELGPASSVACPHEHLKSGSMTLSKLLVLEVSVAVHSLAIGFGLGTQSESIQNIEALLIAMCFHQLFEGFCLGATMIELDLNWNFRMLCNAIFSLSVCIGIIVGILAQESEILDHVSGVANAFAAGCLIYTSIVDIIAEEFSRIVSEPAYAKALMLAATMTGFAFMAILAIWA